MKLIVIFLFIAQICTAQQSGYADIGIGTQGNSGFNLATSIGGGVGHTMLNDLFCFGGVKISKNYISDEDEDKYPYPTGSIYSAELVAGIRYSITIFDFGKLAAIERIGIFPEIRGYFNPYLPRTVTYVNDKDETIDETGKYSTQFAYGIGGGIFAGSLSEGYLALRYDMSTSDPYTTLRTLNSNYKFGFSTGVQHLISISYYFR